MDMQAVIENTGAAGIGWFVAGAILLVFGIAGAMWTMWHVQTVRRAAPAVGRRSAAVCVVLAIGAALIAHSKIRTWQGQWWTLAPTEVLVQASANEGARSALGPRLYDLAGSAEGSAWRQEALSERQWRQFAENRRRVMLDSGRPEVERTAAAIDLGVFIPDAAIVDPILAEVLGSGTCEARQYGTFSAAMYGDHRRGTTPAWLPQLADLASDASCPEIARQSAFALARSRPLPLDDLRRVVASIKGRPEFENVWRAIGSGLSHGGTARAEADGLLAFLAELQASDDPAIRNGVAIMRPLVEARTRPLVQVRARANQNG
jgi:hypothetical protein